MAYGRLALWLLLVLVGVYLATAAVATSIVNAEGTLDKPSSSFLRVIVIGATGDLAAKYLWAACFRLALEWRLSRNQIVRFVAAARDSQEEGDRWKARFFTKSWATRVCDENTSGEATVCQEFYRDEFVPRIAYSTLSTPDDYAALSSLLRDDEEEDKANGRVEIGRLVYLAIPPRAFLPASRSLDEFLRPPSSDAFFRVVIEKPFGRDLASAESLADGLRGFLKDDEMLLMDHYAGKRGLRVIDPFVRRNTATLKSVWNGRHISKVAIVMSETETCEHRIEYFDRIGIIRDVMSNHLQLILGIVVAPSLRHCGESSGQGDGLLDDLCPHELTSFLGSLRPSGDLVVGQYHGYNHGGVNESASTTRSHTATAAFAEISSSHDDWVNTRFSISAAKATAQRRAEVLVTFKSDKSMHHHGEPCSVRFTVQDGALSTGELINVRCAGLGNLSVPLAWEQTSPGTYAPQSTREREVASPAWQLGAPISAYDTLLRDALNGRHDNFMDIDEVLASWRLWSPIILAAETQFTPESIVMYPVGARSWMDFGGLDKWESEGALDDAHEGICPVHDHTLGTMKPSP